MTEKIAQEIRELEANLEELVEQRNLLQREINAIRHKIANKKVYDRYYRGIGNFNKQRSLRDGKTSKELFGKPHRELTQEEMKQYNRIKQAERRTRVKAERKRENERKLDKD